MTHSATPLSDSSRRDQSSFDTLHHALEVQSRNYRTRIARLDEAGDDERKAEVVDRTLAKLKRTAGAH